VSQYKKPLFYAVFSGFAFNFFALDIAVYADTTLPLSGSEAFKKSGLPFAAADQDALTIAQSAVFVALGYAKTVSAILAIFFITLIGYTLVVNPTNEESVTEAKSALAYCILAFVLMGMSEDIGRIFDFSQGTLIENPQQILSRVRLFDRQVEIVITFAKYLIGAVATFMFVKTGAQMVISGAKEDEHEKLRNSLGYTIGALVMIFIGDIFINKVFYNINKDVYSGITGVHPQIDIREGVEQIVGIVNFIVGFVGPLAILGLVAGAVLYAVSRGEEDQMERAKRIIIATGVGIVVIYGSFAIVSTVINGRLEEIDAVIALVKTIA
jgi:hypothetical protein